MVRRSVLLLATVSAAAVFTSSALAAPGAHAAALSPLETGVLAQINDTRAQHHLAPLRVSVKLNAAARAHSGEMAADGYFAHESADGTAFWKRVRGFYSTSAFGYWSVGENLLWSAPDVSPAKALEMWMGSPEHRKNILTARWREIGVSAVHVPAASGVYQGLDVTIVTTDFGVRQ